MKESIFSFYKFRELDFANTVDMHGIRWDPSFACLMV